MLVALSGLETLANSTIISSALGVADLKTTCVIVVCLGDRTTCPSGQYKLRQTQSCFHFQLRQ
jgi:hypothetical protein